ncbi:MAG TPA: ABC transporter permease [Firmicutes bacterium]|nr:ABC transporter permease [Bacillota bacterium]
MANANDKANCQGTVVKRDKFIQLKRAWYKFSLNKTSVIGLVIVVAVAICAIFQPWLAPYPHHAGEFVDFANVNCPPCKEHWCGTDGVGRDILSRIMYAFRGAFTLGLGCLALVVPFGVVMGLIAGYHKGQWISTFIMRVTDVFLSIPPLIMALCVCAILRPTLFNSLLAVSVSWWTWYCRLVYSMTSSLRNEMYVKSAELTGASTAHILFREILPNCFGAVFTKMTLDMGWIILTGASLGFVGMGEQPPIPSLGTMVADGAKYIPGQWWISICPALAIMIIVLGFNLLGDGVKDMLSSEE